MRDKQDIINNPPKFEQVKVTHFPSHVAPETGYLTGNEGMGEKIKQIENPDKTFISTASQDLSSPIVSEEELRVIDKFYQENNFDYQANNSDEKFCMEEMQRDKINKYKADENSAWIQTYSGLRFTPLSPHIDSIVIQDIAHALSMICRFTGHIKSFYSVAQHSVLVSYLCDSEFAMQGLLHDASEAYLVDLPSPLKRSGALDSFKFYEKNLQSIIFKRFNIVETEHPSVKLADVKMLYTEARDLFKVQRSDWENKEEPYPFKIEPVSQQEAKNMFIKRFFELSGHNGAYEHYLNYEYQK